MRLLKIKDNSVTRVQVSKERFGTFTDRFQGRFPVGELVLTYFPDNYAPVRLDAGTLKAGAPRDDLELILKPGHQHQLNIQNEQGEPVTEATVVVHPTWGEGGSGPIFPLKVNTEGTPSLCSIWPTPRTMSMSQPPDMNPLEKHTTSRQSRRHQLDHSESQSENDRADPG